MTENKGASPDQLLELTAVDVVAKLRNGEITAERYASALLARCEKGKALNAFITLPREQVLEAARAADRLRASGAREITSPFSLLSRFEGDKVAYVQFLEDSYGTAGSFKTGGTTRFHSDPAGKEFEV
jgi:hypothetical protein